MGFLDSVYGRLSEHAGPDGLVRIDVALIKKLVEMGIHGGVLNAALDSLVAKKLIARVLDDQYRMLIKSSPGSGAGWLKQSSP
jgi:hypothetical protein